ncbi:MAG: hypothetical protein LQ342_004089 [Letrouitia transgressa]|nr:MAG: hypothetical protein LQ342_004089 [Letrouitia transgressa]
MFSRPVDPELSEPGLPSDKGEERLVTAQEKYEAFKKGVEETRKKTKAECEKRKAEHEKRKAELEKRRAELDRQLAELAEEERLEEIDLAAQLEDLKLQAEVEAAESKMLLSLTPYDNVPCAPGANSTVKFPCCADGDECLSDNICHFTHRPNSVQSGFYVAGCTDQTGKDAACIQACSGNAEPDIVYNSTTSLWHCCGTDSNGITAYDRPTNESFQAPAPDTLSKFSISTSSSSLQSAKISAMLSSTSTSRSSTAPSSASPSPSPTPSPAASENSSGLSGGVKAGISVGVILGVAYIILFLTLAYLVGKRQRRSENDATASANRQQKHEYPRQELPEPQHEVPGQNLDPELDHNRSFHELSNR